MSDAGEVLFREGVRTGYSAKRETFQEMLLKCTGQERNLDPRAFNLGVCGSRLLVVRDIADNEYGESGLVIPDTVREKDPPGSGYIAAVGDMVGAGTGPHPHGIVCHNPSDLLYKRIIFGMYSGSSINLGINQGYESVFWIMTDRDVWFVDWNEYGKD